MSEKRYLFEKRYFVNGLLYLCDNDLSNTLSIFECADLLNEQQATISALKEENEQLRKQMQNYEQLIANSYVGIEETLDGFVGKYVIWEDELQKYRKKNKEVIDDE